METIDICKKGRRWAIRGKKREQIALADIVRQNINVQMLNLYYHKLEKRSKGIVLEIVGMKEKPDLTITRRAKSKIYKKYLKN